MPCYHPLTAWRAPPGMSYGKSVISFDSRSAVAGSQKLLLPCGRCVGCRLERSRQWAIRCIHEASLYDYNCFITLTYAKDPENNSLNVRDFQLFMKKLRKKYGSGIRFFHCGEYGEERGRPHHHAIIFNFDFPDKMPVVTDDGSKVWCSEELNKLWAYGFTSIGDVTFDSCAYVARYIIKKVTGDAAEEHYQGRKPEYVTMSLRPGIGSDWYDKFGDTDVYPKDFITVNGGFKCHPPRYYDKLYNLNHHAEMLKVKERRLDYVSNLDPVEVMAARLAQREQAVLLGLQHMKKRKLK